MKQPISVTMAIVVLECIFEGLAHSEKPALDNRALREEFMAARESTDGEMIVTVWHLRPLLDVGVRVVHGRRKTPVGRALSGLRDMPGKYLAALLAEAHEVDDGEALEAAGFEVDADGYEITDSISIKCIDWPRGYNVVESDAQRKDRELAEKLKRRGGTANKDGWLTPFKH